MLQFENELCAHEIFSLHHYLESAEGSDRILEGYLFKMGGPFLPGWQKRYFLLYPNRIEWRGEQVSEYREQTVFLDVSTGLYMDILG